MSARPEKKVFNEFYIRSLKPVTKTYMRWDKKQANFAICVYPSGRKAWKVVYSFGGKQRWFTIGNVAAIGLADARKIAGRIMVQVANGIDPQAIKVAKHEPETVVEDPSGCTALYRHFDKHGDLLYVGISLNAAARLSQHRNKPWFAQIANVTVEKFATREEALAAEKRAIMDELPRFNVAMAADRERRERELAIKLERLERDVHQPERKPRRKIEPLDLRLLQDDDLLTVPQLEQWLNVSQRWIDRVRGTNEGPPHIQVGTFVKYRVGDVRKWLDSCRVDPAAKKQTEAA
jgi:predicted DNA-binding transcriptional regulator AlpA/predicted GIY-YIG superfamily endonuclease